MKRITVTVAAAAATIFLSLAGQASAQCVEKIQEAGVIRVGVGLMGLKPFIWQEPDGSYTGFEKEIADYIAGELGVTTEYVVTEWTTLIPGLKSDRWDVILSGMSKTQERIQGGGIEFSNPYFLIFDRVIVLEDSPIQSVEDLDGKVLASTLGTMDSLVAHSLVDQGLAESVMDFNTFGEPFLALRNEQVDAVVMDETTYLAQLEEMPDLRVVGEPLYYIPKAEWAEAEESADYRLGGLGVGVRQECTDLKAAVDQALADMAADGTREEILRKYDIWSDEQINLMKN
ncbi:MAG: transporter substrate-binding domain-containing protein [Rhodospirillaceae bacterium]|nr:transporter substrate-binding domain-containing protein [Rhodospirillaceae bacterium]